MKVAIYSQDQEQTVKSIKLTLESHGIESVNLGKKSLGKDIDYVIVTGGDRGVTKIFPPCHRLCNSRAWNK